MPLWWRLRLPALAPSSGVLADTGETAELRKFLSRRRACALLLGRGALPPASPPPEYFQKGKCKGMAPSICPFPNTPAGGFHRSGIPNGRRKVSASMQIPEAVGACARAETKRMREALNFLWRIKERGQRTPGSIASGRTGVLFAVPWCRSWRATARRGRLRTGRASRHRLRQTMPYRGCAP